MRITVGRKSKLKVLDPDGIPVDAVRDAERVRYGGERPYEFIDLPAQSHLCW
jgi:hypothetical protein